MGNICSGCQRDKEDSRHTESYRIDKNIPISLFIEKQRVHYTDTVKNRQSKSHFDSLADSNAEKPVQIDNGGYSVQEFWKKNNKNIKGFNPTFRPSTTYQIDYNLALRHTNGYSDKFESTYYDTDIIKLNSSATIIQKWYKKLKKQRNNINTSSIYNSSNLLNINNQTQASYSMNTIDLSVRQF